MLCATPRVGPFSLLVARPYSFLDVDLDFQANVSSERGQNWRSEVFGVASVDVGREQCRITGSDGSVHARPLYQEPGVPCPHVTGSVPTPTQG